MWATPSARASTLRAWWSGWAPARACKRGTPWWASPSSARTRSASWCPATSSSQCQRACPSHRPRRFRACRARRSMPWRSRACGRRSQRRGTVPCSCTQRRAASAACWCRWRKPSAATPSWPSSAPRTRWRRARPWERRRSSTSRRKTSGARRRRPRPVATVPSSTRTACRRSHARTRRWRRRGRSSSTASTQTCPHRRCSTRSRGSACSLGSCGCRASTRWTWCCPPSRSRDSTSPSSPTRRGWSAGTSSRSSRGSRTAPSPSPT
mmetsp:Transcript_14754/g.47728  ORF Transcript_14754/g.47728 Transcript_14754/m.47728 type:complete len:266 (+) Transcript_14754:228-1025(+)